MQEILKIVPLTVFEKAERATMDELVADAIKLLEDNETPEGYHLAFSGGKDSCVIKALADLAGVKYEAVYANTTIDPPELVRFIKKYHPEVTWVKSKHGNMMHRVATRSGIPPTRKGRWCCEEYKEFGGAGRMNIFGVRAAESPRRKKMWHPITETTFGDPAVCPIVYWSDAQVWEFIKSRNIPYCELYDEGFTRLGCIGCPLASKKNIEFEFERYPKYKANWKRAIIKNWENWKDIPNSRTGEPRHQAKYKSGEDYWLWWTQEYEPDIIRDECQSSLLWTNEPGINSDEKG